MNPPQAPEILPTHTPELFDSAVKRAAAELRGGGVVAVPTETVYGLAGNALDADAVARIFAAKGRPAHNPVIVHVASIEMARRCVASWTLEAQRLASAFWPGPLTMVLPKSAEVPGVVTAGGDTVGVRWPSHPFMQALIRECGFPLAAPSANPSNELSPTSAAHVARSLGGRVRLIVDGGGSQVGIESTVVDLTCKPARVLRPGMIHASALAAVIGEVSGFEFRVSSSEVLRSPGQLQTHYSPKARLIIMSWADEAELHRLIVTRRLAMGEVFVVAHSHIPLSGEFGRVSVVPHDAEAFARALYAELHACDEAGAKFIVVEAPPEGPEWDGIRDRLRRAAGR